MFVSLYARLITFAVIALLVVAGVGYYGHTRYRAGQTAVQAKWDAVKAAQAVTAITASEKSRATESRQSQDFAGIASGYLQATSHAYPSLADALPAAVAAGTVQLRNDCPAASASGGVSEATARSRAADAAATAALSQRVQDSVTIVRIAEQSDIENRRLRAQVIGLQSVLKAERSHGPE